VRQALHIFKKDVRHLRWDIALLLLTIFLFAWSEMRVPFSAWGGYFASYGRVDVMEALIWVNPLSQVLVVALAVVLVARAVHGEALPGDKQFWLTRPYSWKSLLGAKCLFLAVFLILPMTLSDMALVSASGFRVSQYLPGLVWEQVLRGAVVLAPALALAAVTRNATSQILTALGLGVFFTLCSSAEFGSTGASDGLAWVYEAVTTLLLAACAATIVWWQYQRRGTAAARIVFGAAALAVSLLPLVPRSAALAMERLGSKSRIEAKEIHLTLDEPIFGPSRTLTVTAEDLAQHPRYLQVQLHVSGVPEGMQIWADQLEVEVRAENPQASSPWQRLGTGWNSRDSFHAEIVWGTQQSRIDWQAPLRMRVSGLMTLGANSRKTSIEKAGSRLAVAGLGLCLKAPEGNAISYCRMPFRGPRTIAAMFGQPSLPTYSPFPAELALDPVVPVGQSFPLIDSYASQLVLEDPVDHFFCSFELEVPRPAACLTARTN
jgi:hypothetical protein